MELTVLNAILHLKFLFISIGKSLRNQNLECVDSELKHDKYWIGMK